MNTLTKYAMPKRYMHGKTLYFSHFLTLITMVIMLSWGNSARAEFVPFAEADKSTITTGFTKGKVEVKGLAGTWSLKQDNSLMGSIGYLAFCVTNETCNICNICNKTKRGYLHRQPLKERT